MNSIHEALFEKLRTVLQNVSEEQWDKTIWSELFHYGIQNYIKTIRDVIRFINVFTLKYELLK